MPNDRPAKKAAASNKKVQHKGRTTLAEAASNPKDLQVTPASEWGKKSAPVEEGFVTELPSGNVVRMTRTLDLPSLLATGQIPNPLAGIVKQMMEDGQAVPPATNDMNVIVQMMDMFNSQFVKSVLEPQFDMPAVRKHNESDEAYQKRLSEWEPEEGKISVFDVQLMDKMFVFAVGQGAPADLALFREQQSATFQLLQAGEGMGDAS